MCARSIYSNPGRWIAKSQAIIGFRGVVTRFRPGPFSNAKRIEHIMTHILKSAFRPILLLSLTIAAAAMAQAETAAPPNAVVYLFH